MSALGLNPLDIALLASGLVLWIVGITRGWLPAWWFSHGRMAPWTIGGTDFLLFCLLVFTFTNVAPFLALRLVGAPLDSLTPTNEANLAAAFGTHLGGLLACALFRIHPAGRAMPEEAPLRPAMIAAVVAFILTMPLLAGATLGWQHLLHRFGLETPVQDIVEFVRNAKGPLQTSLWVVLAVGIAPVTEELVLRAGLFRFLAMRMSAERAALLSAGIFALLHFNLYSFVPLLGLGVVLALVYHRSGRLAGSILLHSIFNAFTVIGILLSPPDIAPPAP
jgi:uncharacterized protein